ncbi:MAG: GFA family protein [Gammaproteobacteria bacterium]|nr:GFA family protein [Gammaproteobacteria bacterium]
MAKSSSSNTASGGYTGSCVCGAISYRAAALRPLWYCHCRQCRNITGHFMAAAQVDLDQIVITGQPKWYYVSATSRYGFCPDCGAQMFWRNDENEYLSVTGGSIDDARNLTVKGHIFAYEKGQYYDLPKADLRYAQHCPPGEL